MEAEAGRSHKPSPSILPAQIISRFASVAAHVDMNSPRTRSQAWEKQWQRPSRAGVSLQEAVEMNLEDDVLGALDPALPEAETTCELSPRDLASRHSAGQ